MAVPFDPNKPQTYPGQNPYTASQDIDINAPTNGGALYDLYADVPPHILYLKDSIAGTKKQTMKYADMFAPENLPLDTEEYNSALNEKKVAETTSTAMQTTAQLSDEQFVDRINGIRKMTGQMPLPKDDPALKDPNMLQALAGALGAIFTPEFAFDISAIPFQHQLGVQEDEKTKQERLYQIELEKFNRNYNLSLAEADSLDKRELARFDVDTKREFFEKGNAFQAGEAQKGRDFQQGIFNQETQRTFNILDKEQKFTLAMQWVQMATNPNVGPDARKAAAETLKGLGIDIKVYEGLTTTEQAAKLDMELATNEDKRRSELFPLQKDQLARQNTLLDKEIKWYDPKAKAEIDTARANIANINSIIQDRNFQQSFQLSEQQRAYLGGVQENILGSIRAIGTQVETNSARINNINTQLAKSGLTDEEKTALEAEKKTLITQNESLSQYSTEMQSQLDGFNEVFVERSGAAMGASGLGEKYLGTPYLWGGKGENGIDCSGLTYRVAMEDFGVKLPHGAVHQWNFAEKNGMVVDLSDPNNLKTGDFVYFSDGAKWHTGVVIFKDGVPYLRNAPSTGKKVQDQPLSVFLKGSKKLVGAARFWKEVKSPETEKLDPAGGMPMGGG